MGDDPPDKEKRIYVWGNISEHNPPLANYLAVNGSFRSFGTGVAQSLAWAVLKFKWQGYDLVLGDDGTGKHYPLGHAERFFSEEFLSELEEKAKALKTSLS